MQKDVVSIRDRLRIGIKWGYEYIKEIKFFNRYCTCVRAYWRTLFLLYIYISSLYSYSKPNSFWNNIFLRLHLWYLFLFIELNCLLLTSISYLISSSLYFQSQNSNFSFASNIYFVLVVGVTVCIFFCQYLLYF